MMLLTKANLKALPPLYANDKKPADDAVVHVKFFTPDSSWTWLATEYDPETRRFFGWADDGRGGGELGYFSLTELEKARGPYGLKIERDRGFKPKPLGDAKIAEGLVR